MTLKDFIAGLQRRVPEGVPQRAVGDLRLMRELVRSRYHSVLNKHPWSFLHEWKEAVVPAAYTDGTVTLTKGSATVSGSGTTWAAELVGRFLVVGSEVPLRIASVSGTTTLVLETPWVQETSADLSYSIRALEVQTGAKRVLGINTKDGWLWRRTLPFFDRIDPKRTSGGTPRAYATRGETTSGMLVEVFPYPLGGAVVRTLGLKAPSALDSVGDVITFPNLYVLELGVRADLYKYVYSETGDQKYVSLAGGEEAMFQALLDEMIEEDRVSASWPSSLPETESGDALDYLSHDTLPW